MALAECLMPYKVKDLSLPTELVTLQHPKHRLFDAIRLLSEHRLLSVPVLDEDGKLLGSLDSLDILAHVVEAEAEGKGKLLSKHIDHIMGKVYSASPAIHLEDSLSEVVAKIAGPARRAVVLGKGGRPESVVTQSTVIKFLLDKKIFQARRRHWLAKNLCTAGVVVASESETALKVFQKLLERKVSSLVILDEDGCPLAVVSASDLVHGLAKMQDMSDAISVLGTANVMQFITDSRLADARTSHTRAAVISVPPDAPLTEVIEKLAKTRVHRLVVMGEGHTPLGMLSLSDICRAVSENHVGEEGFGGA